MFISYILGASFEERLPSDRVANFETEDLKVRATAERAETDGPIRSIELTHGRDQMLNVDFEQRMTSQCFSTDVESTALLPQMPPAAVLEMA